MPGISKVAYVFLAMPHDEDREFRMAELAGRCRVARSIHRDHDTVIGIATEVYEEGKGYSFDLHYLNIPHCSDELIGQVQDLQREFGYFVDSQKTRIEGHEYPQGGA